MRNALYAALAVAVATAARAAVASPLEIQAGPAAGTASMLVVAGRVVTPGASRLVPRPPHVDSPPADDLGAFLVHDVEDARVIVEVDGRKVVTRSGDEGYFRAVFHGGAPLTPGTFVATVAAEKGHDRGTRKIYAQVVPDGPGLTVVSDFDDTVVVTGVRHFATLVENGFLKGPESLAPVPHMAGLYRCLESAGHAPRLVQYVTATPTNLQFRLIRFLAYQHFPRGPVVTKHLSLAHLGDLKAYKVKAILALAKRFPGHRFVLLGDDGQKDPEVYRAVEKAIGKRVAAILIREIPGIPVAKGRLDGMIPFHDGTDAGKALARLGLVDAACARTLTRPRRPHVAGR